MIEKNCHHCNEPFETKRASSLYCSATCRQRAYRNRTTKENDTNEFGLIPLPVNLEPEREENELLPSIFEDVLYGEVHVSALPEPVTPPPAETERIPPLVRLDPSSPYFDPDPLLDYRAFAEHWYGEEAQSAKEYNQHLQSWLEELLSLERDKPVRLKMVKKLLRRILEERGQLKGKLSDEYPYIWWVNDTLIPRLKKFVVVHSTQGIKKLVIQLEERLKAEVMEVLYVVSEV